MFSLFKKHSLLDKISKGMERTDAGNYIEAINILESILEEAKADTSNNFYRRIVLELGECYLSICDNDETGKSLNTACKYYEEALLYYTKSNDPYGYIYISNKIGKIRSCFYEENNDPKELQSAISSYKQAVEVFESKADIYTTIYDYKTNSVKKLSSEDYIYFRASIWFNLASSLKEKLKLDGSDSDEYLNCLSDAINNFKYVINTLGLHQVEYLNSRYNLGQIYSMQFEESRSKQSYDNALHAYEDAIKYFSSNVAFKDIYPDYFDAIVLEIKKIKENSEKPDGDAGSTQNDNVNKQADVCANCGNADIISGHSMPLCKKCREVYTAFRVPEWIKLFSLIIMIFFLFAIVRVPHVLNAAIDYERGIKADKEKKCQTALSYLKAAQKEYPESLLINSRIFIDLAKCSKYQEAAGLYNSKIAGKKSKDKALIDEISNAYESVFMTNENIEELLKIKNSLTQTNTDEVILALKEYNDKNARNVEGLILLSNIYFDRNDFSSSRDLNLKALSLQPDRGDIRLSLAGVYRQTGELDKSLQECEYILNNVNAENTFAIGSIARLYIKKHQFKEALEYARKAIALDPEDTYNIQTMALSFHFNKMDKERDEMFEKIKNANYNQQQKNSDLQFLKEVFDGTSKLYS